MKRTLSVWALLSTIALTLPGAPAWAGSSGGGGGGNTPSYAGSCATSGSLSGVKVHIGDYTTTGAITATGLRLICTGAVTISHNITVQPEIAAAPRRNTDGIGEYMREGDRGGGIGGGPGRKTSDDFRAAGSAAAGSFGGAGGVCGSGAAGYTGKPGLTYTPDQQFCGSGGSAGWVQSTVSGAYGGAGGRGGGGLYIQGRSVTINATIAANGEAGEAGAGVQGSGAPGSGGVIDIRSIGSITLGASAILRANGGNGTTSEYSSTGGGGGGYINLMAGGSITEDGSSTVEAAGGTAAASGGSQVEAATNGSAGVINRISGQFTPRYF